VTEGIFKTDISVTDLIRYRVSLIIRLFNNGGSTAQVADLYRRMRYEHNDWWICKDLEGGSSSLFQGSVTIFA